ncbi:MAG: glycosyltransferase [Candidatus Latescibacteria bacterium]|nr:glycosyltransferase [Candidatus Latescibacterota bacterium]
MSAFADIAVVITAHNYGHYLAACLDSVFSQTLLPQQVVVVDDASEDDTATVVRAFSNVEYCRVDFRNGNRARNFGFLKVAAEYVAFFDADNMMMPQFLDVLYGALCKNPEATFAYGDRVNFAEGDSSNHLLPVGLHKSGPFEAQRLKRANYIDLAALIRSDRFPGFDPVLRRYQDWDLWLNIALKQGGSGLYVPEALFRYRVHSQSVSQREDRDLAQWAIRQKYGMGWGALPLLRHSFFLYRCAQWIKAHTWG